MEPNYKDLEKRVIDIKKVKEVWNMYKEVLTDIEWHMDNISEMDPVSLEIDLENFKRIKDILLLP